MDDGVEHDRIPFMAGVQCSTPFSISAHELERVGVAKFAMMFGSEFADPNVICQMFSSPVGFYPRGFARPSFDSIQSFTRIQIDWNLPRRQSNHWHRYWETNIRRREK